MIGDAEAENARDCSFINTNSSRQIFEGDFAINGYLVREVKA
jgi:hypothetical protein